MIKKSEIPNDTVTYAKMQNASSANVVLGNDSAAGERLRELSVTDLQAMIGGGAAVTISDTPPASPSEGDRWFDSNTATEYVYYDSYWISVSFGLGIADSPTNWTDLFP